MATENIIYNTAINDGMPETLAKLIVAQSKHETGNYSSKFFKLYNNAFGYSYSKGSKWQLPTGGTNADNNQPIARYKSVADSTHELTDWIKRRVANGKFPKDLKSITTASQYASLLKNAGYYGDTITNYLSGLIRFLKDIKGNPSSLIVLIVVISFIFILLYNN